MCILDPLRASLLAATKGDLHPYSMSGSFSGDPSERATPVPIPNTAVKPLSSDDTARATAWESRSSPGIMKSPRSNPRAFLFSAILLRCREPEPAVQLDLPACPIPPPIRRPLRQPPEGLSATSVRSGSPPPPGSPSPAECGPGSRGSPRSSASRTVPPGDTRSEAREHPWGCSDRPSPSCCARRASRH
jgi:hypothetical protein